LASDVSNEIATIRLCAATASSSSDFSGSTARDFAFAFFAAGSFLFEDVCPWTRGTSERAQSNSQRDDRDMESPAKESGWVYPRGLHVSEDDKFHKIGTIGLIGPYII
jgi:hypothetical protein